VLDSTREDDHSLFKKKSMKAWEEQMATRDAHYASIRRTRGASFGKSVGKVNLIRDNIRE
jgi:hypothetical protein